MFLNDGCWVNSKDAYSSEPHNLLLDYSEEAIIATERSSITEELEVHLPRPLCKPFKSAEDIVQRLLNQKAEYVQLKNKQEVDVTKVERETFGKSEYITITKGLLDFYKTKDPDVYVNTDYNIYYTTGCLETVVLNDRQCLVRPNIDNRLCLNFLDDPSEIVVVPYQFKSPIHQISNYNVDNSNIVLIREKSAVNLAHLQEDNVNVKAVRNFTFPLFDSKIDEQNKKIGVLTADLRLRVGDISVNKYTRTFHIAKHPTYNFAQFQFVDENVIYCMNHFDLFVCDVRCKKVTKTNLKLSDCNFFCNLRTNNDDIFLSTRHYLIKTDKRNFNDCLYYSHALTAAPCYMDFLNNENILCLASQEEKDKVLFNCNSSITLPTLIPSLNATVKECQLRYDVLLYEALEERLNYSITGTKLVRESENIFLYFSNSLGEVFKQKIHVDKESEESEDAAYKVMHNWITGLEKPDPVVNATHIEDTARLRFSLQKGTQSNLNTYTRKGNADKFLKEFGTQYNIDNVGELAKEFLSIWVVEGEELEEEQLPEVPIYDKVSSWIQGTAFDDHSLSMMDKSLQ